MVIEGVFDAVGGGWLQTESITKHESIRVEKLTRAFVTRYLEADGCFLVLCCALLTIGGVGTLPGDCV